MYIKYLCLYMSILMSTMPRNWKELAKAIRVVTMTTVTTHQYVPLLKCLHTKH